MSEPSICRECGALMGNVSKHKSWHSDLERKLRDLESKVRRAARS